MKNEYKGRLPKLWEKYLEQVPDDKIPTIHQLVNDDGENLWETYAEAVKDISKFLRATNKISLENIPATMIDALTRVGLGENDFTEDYEFRDALVMIKTRYEKQGRKSYPLPNGANDEAGNVMGSIKMKLNQGRNRHGRDLW